MNDNVKLKFTVNGLDKFPNGTFLFLIRLIRNLIYERKNLPFVFSILFTRRSAGPAEEKTEISSGEMLDQKVNMGAC